MALGIPFQVTGAPGIFTACRLWARQNPPGRPTARQGRGPGARPAGPTLRLHQAGVGVHLALGKNSPGSCCGVTLCFTGLWNQHVVFLIQCFFGDWCGFFFAISSQTWSIWWLGAGSAIWNGKAPDICKVQISQYHTVASILVPEQTIDLTDSAISTQHGIKHELSSFSIMHPNLRGPMF